MADLKILRKHIDELAEIAHKKISLTNNIQFVPEPDIGYNADQILCRLVMIVGAIVEELQRQFNIGILR